MLIAASVEEIVKARLESRGSDMLRRNRNKDRDRPLDRLWSAHRNVHAGNVGKDLVSHGSMPAETGPTWAPDQLSVWPVEGGCFGIDAHYHGSTGVQRARRQAERLTEAGLSPSVRRGPHDGATVRLGPLAHEAAWIALEAFLGRPLHVAI